jgi:hypothetical protein
VSAADRDAAVGDGDIARAETVLPLAGKTVFDFLRDVERLFRLNPQLAIAQWTPAERGFRCAGYNESNERPFDVGVRVDIDPAALTLAFRYDTGLKRETRLAVAPHAEGVLLTVSEHYPRLADANDPRVAEVDKSLVPWVAALRRHLLARRRWGRLPPVFPLWRWWHERLMPSLAPRERRIARLLVWTTAAEFAIFLAAIAVLRFST